MVVKGAPTIEDEKVRYFEEQLLRELSNLFIWEGLPSTVPHDYLEQNLIRNGYVLYYEDESIGADVLRCSITGYNRHDRPTNARTYTATSNAHEDFSNVDRRLRYLSDSKDVVDTFDKTKDGVLIRNMESGQTAWEIVRHYARRLALAQQAFDTQLLYANMPYIFATSDKSTKLSIERMFKDIFDGKPLIIADDSLFKDNKDRTGIPTQIQFIAKEIFDVINEIKMDFRQTIGIDTAGVEKAERVNTLEIESNEQATKNVLQIMLSQRKQAVEAINEFFEENISVDVIGGSKEENTEVENEEEEEETFGISNGRIT